MTLGRTTVGVGYFRATTSNKNSPPAPVPTRHSPHPSTFQNETGILAFHSTDLSQGDDVLRESRVVHSAVGQRSSSALSLVRRSSTHPRLCLVTQTQNATSPQAAHS